MPDLDVISRTAPRGWGRPMRLLVNSPTDATTVRSVVKAIAASLRREGGFPGFAEFVAILDDVMHGQLDPHSAHVKFDSIERQYRQARHTKVCARAARSILAEVGAAHSLSQLAMPEMLARRAIRRLVDANLLGYLTPGKLKASCPAPARVDEIREALELGLHGPIRRLARSVASDPDCAGIRAPRVERGAPIGTTQLLDQPIM